MTHQENNRAGRLRRRCPCRQARQRRGVLLLVVLSMLVLFMMIGTAFLLTSGQFRAGAKAAAKLNRVGNNPSVLLDRALYQVLRDTDIPNSAVRYHSLLRDMYGTDGFEAQVRVGTYARGVPITDQTPLGPTAGQLIDLYLVPDVIGQNEIPAPRHVIALESDLNNQPVLHALPRTMGYYNGSLLTVTSGPARGQSARIVGYENFGADSAVSSLFDGAENVWRLRVMSLANADGTSLLINNSASPPELSGLQQATIVVNGRPFNGTGVGLNALARVGEPRLTAFEMVQGAAYEIALMPNSVYFDATASGPVPYGRFPGPGGSDESYDAPDFQNVFLAHETVTPRARGRLVVSGTPLSPDDPSFGAATKDFGTVERLDLEDLPLPSFHRPALVNYWFHRLVSLVAEGGNPTDGHVHAVLQPYGADGIRGTSDDPQQVSLATRDQIVALKRKFIMRPLREDHPKFDGSNQSSRARDWADDSSLVQGGASFSISAPYWEAMGPWDVDNDNDGVNDSVWIDLGDPVQQAEDGTLYKPLYAFKIVDLDSRLNVNAHGTAEHINPPIFDTNRNVLAGSVTSAIPAATDLLPQGVGWGTAEISLRPLFPALKTDINLDSIPDFLGNRQEGALANGLRDPSVGVDDYATLLAGRATAEGGLRIPGRYGFDPATANDTVPLGRNVGGVLGTQDAGAGMTAADTPDARAQYDLFDFPRFWNDVSGFGSPPDLMGRYAMGLDHRGQPAWEGAAEPGQSMLADAPYELDLSSVTRRDSRTDELLVRYNSGTGETEYYDASGALVSSLAGFVSEEDDAPYATADLERILRAHDPDAGTVPSRLWDVVDVFNPDKLVFDPRISGTPNNPSSIQIVAAQQQADINRRIVTTDSSDLPVPGDSLSSRIALGADSLPGLPGVDDDNNGVVDDISELNTVSFTDGSDDYQVMMAMFSDATAADLQPPISGQLHDYLRYRVILALLRSGVLGARTTMAVADTFVNQVVYGASRGPFTAQSPSGEKVPVPLTGGTLLAPELLSGLRMDINRPFGNGNDDNLNGVVDEPGENYSRSGPIAAKNERLWDRSQANARMSFPGMPDGGVAFSHTGGTDVDNQPNQNNQLDVDGDDAELARQLYARHLYVLMMLLMDEQHLAPLDIENPNVRLFLEDIVQRLREEQPNLDVQQLRARAEVIASRKLTAQRIAQWAVNCVDFRDPDAIMTPFEYDENPFDGWGVFTQQGTFIPLDGDIATNENWGPKEPHQNAQDFPRYNGYALPKKDDPDSGEPRNDALVEQATRGIVWGAERPELLITETLAFHDRRATDETDGSTHSQINDPDPEQADDDLDQRLVPRGALFVELYNPWTPDGQRPAEIYRYSGNEAGPAQDGLIDPAGRHLASGLPYEGVLLNRLSNLPSTLTNKFSPVWRMIAIQDAGAGRLTDGIAQNEEDLNALRLLKLGTIDPDGYGFESDKFAERYIYFTTGIGRGGNPDRTQRGDDNNLRDAPGTAGEYRTMVNPVMNNLDVHVPPLPLRRIDGLNGEGPQNTFPAARRYFVARQRRQANVTTALAKDAPIAPILPGRYAVIGPSGLQYTAGDSLAIGAGTTTERYVTPVGRIKPFGADEQTDEAHTGSQTIRRTRRIELLPSVDPDLQQIFIDDNVGAEFVRVPNSFANATDQNRDGQPDNNKGDFPDVTAYTIAPPSVAIAVEDLSISEPVEGYPGIRYRELHRDNEGGDFTDKPRMNGSGEFEFDTPADTPMDMEFELVRNGTTQNYRSIQLQRLANPLLPWNPPAYDQFGEVNALHDPSMPVNPYMTIDSLSADLTAFNGVSAAERNLPSVKANEKLQQDGMDPITADPLLQGFYFTPLTPEEVLRAPNLVLAQFIEALVRAGIIPEAGRPTVEQYRGRTPAVIANDLDQLERARLGSYAGTLASEREELLSEDEPHGGQWGWHKLRRFLPDDPFATGQPSTLGGDTFRQYIHLRSLERGAHDRVLKTTGWIYDPQWEPRLLWKAERPNGTVYVPNKNPQIGSNPIRPLSDLVSSKSRRWLDIQSKDQSGPNLTEDDTEFHAFMADDRRKWSRDPHVFDFAMETTLGFANEAYAPPVDFMGFDETMMIMGGGAGQGAPKVDVAATGNLETNLEPAELKKAPYDPREILSTDANEGANLVTAQSMVERREQLLRSTYPWLSWSDRPFVSHLELLQVPASSSSRMLIDYSVINSTTLNPYDGDGVDNANGMPESFAQRQGHQNAPFGHLFNFFAAAFSPARQEQDVNDFDGDGNTTEFVATGAGHHYRLLDFVHVPSRFVNTESLLNPLAFGAPNLSTVQSLGDPQYANDPRRHLQPPFNKVSHFREPGRVNLNTVSGRRVPTSGDVPPQIWSEVYDGIMHRLRDGERYRDTGGVLETAEAAHFGPAWRDVVLSRRGYAHFALGNSSVDKRSGFPDAFASGLNRNFPTFFANPFRSSTAGDLVPLQNMVQLGVNASLLRAHPFSAGDGHWGGPGTDDDLQHQPQIAASSRRVDDTREAGFHSDPLSARSNPGAPDNVSLPNVFTPPVGRNLPSQSNRPLFSESFTAPHIDAERNPFFYYQPLTRLGNTVTTRSGVFAIWITVGYFEVEPAPDWNEDASVRERFSNNRELYDRVYPDGYQLGRELGIDTGDVRRQRAFYIVDRTLPVGFKPGEDLNVELMIRLRRRIE